MADETESTTGADDTIDVAAAVVTDGAYAWSSPTSRTSTRPGRRMTSSTVSPTPPA